MMIIKAVVFGSDKQSNTLIEKLLTGFLENIELEIVDIQSFKVDPDLSDAIIAFGNNAEKQLNGWITKGDINYLKLPEPTQLVNKKENFPYRKLAVDKLREFNKLLKGEKIISVEKEETSYIGNIKIKTSTGEIIEASNKETAALKLKELESLLKLLQHKAFEEAEIEFIKDSDSDNN